ncbi:MAG: hypothetical protein ACYDH2_04030 [Anaerolineaceae bacterium]
MEKKIIIAGIFFTLIIVSGLWLSRSERPINIMLLTLHKLISVGTIVFLGISMYRINQLSPLNSVEIVLCAITLFIFLVLVATGGLLSTDKTVNAIILTIHKYCPILVVIFTVATIYLVMGRKL